MGGCSYILAPDELKLISQRRHRTKPQRRYSACFAPASTFFNLIEPPKGVDVFMVAPKGPGHAVPVSTQKVAAFHVLFIHQDASGTALKQRIACAVAATLWYH